MGLTLTEAELIEATGCANVTVIPDKSIALLNFSTKERVKELCKRGSVMVRDKSCDIMLANSKDMPTCYFEYANDLEISREEIIQKSGCDSLFTHLGDNNKIRVVLTFYDQGKAEKVVAKPLVLNGKLFRVKLGKNEFQGNQKIKQNNGKQNPHNKKVKLPTKVKQAGNGKKFARCKPPKALHNRQKKYLRGDTVEVVLATAKPMKDFSRFMK